MRGRAARARDAMEPSTATLEDLTPVRKRLQVEVPADAVQAELDRTFHEVGQRARLRGFRPGKAPRPVLERAFGEEVRRQVLGRLVEDSFHRAVETHGLAVVGTPDIDAEPITPGAALRYSATVDVRPTIALGELSGLRVARPTTRVGDEEVEQALGAMREAVAQLRPVEDRALIEAGGVVRVDLSSRLQGGEPSRREGGLLQAGAGSLPPPPHDPRGRRGGRAGARCDARSGRPAPPGRGSRADRGGGRGARRPLEPPPGRRAVTARGRAPRGGLGKLPARPRAPAGGTGTRRAARPAGGVPPRLSQPGGRPGDRPGRGRGEGNARGGAAAARR